MVDQKTILINSVIDTIRENGLQEYLNKNVHLIIKIEHFLKQITLDTLEDWYIITYWITKSVLTFNSDYQSRRFEKLCLINILKNHMNQEVN